MKKVVALGMNAFQRKQIHEFQKIADMGYSIDLFTNDSTKNSDNEANKIAGLIRHYTLKKHTIKRIIQLANYFISEKDIKLAHIYPGGRFAWIYLVYCKLKKIRSVCIEWGNLLDWDRLDLMTKFSMIVCYKYCDAVWYKEPYMEEKIRKLGGKKLFFIHNCYNGYIEHDFNQKREYDFIWANRLIPQRYVFWFANGLKKNELYKTKNLLLGLQENLKEDDPINIIQTKILHQKPNNLEILKFQTPFYFYRMSIFFVLPSSIVFGNNSLIEAMSYGVIPIVTNAFGHELIVVDGYNGFVSENNEIAFIQKMIYAHSLSGGELKTISENAIKSIHENFSIEQWTTKVDNLYKSISQ